MEELFELAVVELKHSLMVVGREVFGRSLGECCNADALDVAADYSFYYSPRIPKND